MNDKSIRQDYAGMDYVENNRQPEHLGGTGPSWRDAYDPPTCPECGAVLTRGHDHRDHYYCMDCDVEYAADEVE